MPNDRDKKLDEVYKMTRDNNKMLRSMKRAAFWGTVFKLFIYAVLLGIPVYLYFTIFQPVLDNFVNAYSQMQQAGNQMQQAGTQFQDISKAIPFEQLQALLERIPGVDFSGTSQ